MNHKKAIPANGTRFSANAMVARCDVSVSHAPLVAVSDGAEMIRSTRARPSSSEKTIPAAAAAAARGVRRLVPVMFLMSHHAARLLGPGTSAGRSGLVLPVFSGSGFP